MDMPPITNNLDEMTKLRIQKAENLSATLSTEIASLVPSVFKSHNTWYCHPHDFQLQAGARTDQITHENEHFEIEKMCLEAKIAWLGLMVKAMKKGRVFRLVTNLPYVDVSYQEGFYLCGIMAPFATKVTEQQPSSSTTQETPPL